ncbi:unnamed protein product [Caenorhabditis bovis]|uniref:DUF7083 domain-containing protein n=1 Tax=Caenorhabditis bovis TaxID=2654633 RepID=A0A8S1EKY6_9PELO|nr:unnamed protein product [Caenorhabditis bovis]
MAAVLSGLDKSKLFNALSSQIPIFSYDRDAGKTFDEWYTRYEDVVSAQGQDLDEASRARLIITKLDAATYNRFTSSISPRKPSDLSFEETINVLKTRFNAQASRFRRRYEFSNTEFRGSTQDDIEDYLDELNVKFDRAEIQNATRDEHICIAFISGLRRDGHQHLRMRALQVLESNPNTTPRQLMNELKQMMEVREDEKLKKKKPREIGEKH